MQMPQKIIGQIPQLPPDGGMNLPNKSSGNSLYLIPFVEHELINLVKSRIKNKRSAGPDGVPSFLIKTVINSIAVPLCHLVNLSFVSGYFPERLKVGKTVPLYKKGDPHMLDNYRPVSLLSVFSKIFEHCFLKRLTEFVNDNDLLIGEQHGFRRDHSTSTAIHDAYNKIINFIERGECPVGIFCDLSRAFDCVMHDKLLDKLYNLGVRGIPHDWVCSYLKNRRQFVSIHHINDRGSREVSSSMQYVNVGVPQGSVLGPVLFILYINDIIRCSTAGVYWTLFADDTSLIISHKDSNEIGRRCNVALADLCRWFSVNSLFLNFDKTFYLRFHTYQNRSCVDLDLEFDKKRVVRKEAIKFLGLHFDSTLSWDVHCGNLIAKLSSVCFLVRSLKTVLGRQHLVNFYHAQVGSRLSYGIIFWGRSSLTQRVFVCQKKILRCIVGVDFAYSCRTLFPELRILPLACVYIYEVCVSIYKCRDSYLINKELHEHNLRHGGDFRLPFNRLKLGQNSPVSMGLRIFNALPFRIKDCPGLSEFRRELRRFLLLHCFYSVDEYFNV